MNAPAPLRIVMAPDWRKGVPYQELLSRALVQEGAHVGFLSGYRRGLPLTRGLSEHQADVLHLHWPEAFFPAGPRSAVRALRMPLDLAIVRRRHGIVLTAHNLLAHNRHQERLATLASRSAYRSADAVICHSSAAAEIVTRTFRLSDDRLHVIPHGDLAPAYPALVSHAEARTSLGIDPARRVFLMFGVLAPYKGIEEMIEAWSRHTLDADLHIVGKPISEDYAGHLARSRGLDNRIKLHTAWLSDEQLIQWLSACDVTVFNYPDTLTSGAACLARSLDVPIMLPAHLRTIDLVEPSPKVFRFETTASPAFEALLDRALAAGSLPDESAPWRALTSWPRIAQAHIKAYEAACRRLS